MSQPGNTDPTLREAQAAWQEETLDPQLQQQGERLPRFETQALH